MPLVRHPDERHGGSGACGNGRNARTRAWAARRSSRPCAQFG
ncbi:hypothetical protein BURPS406E_H1347 [Burkholderia pseudomallei 406e]|nr:hypothetical protein BURPS406E_H1347 [Burkholderia pseudomallei 406e]